MIYAFEAVAEAVGMTEDAVKKRFDRACSKLRCKRIK